MKRLSVLVLVGMVAGRVSGQAVPPQGAQIPGVPGSRVENPRVKEAEKAREKMQESRSNPANQALLDEVRQRLQAGERKEILFATPLNPVTSNFGSPAPSRDRATEIITLSVEGQRPLLEFADALQKRTGVPISYEDPIWTWQGDSIRYAEMSPEKLKAAETLRMQSTHSELRLPKGGTLEVSFPVFTGTKLPPGDLRAAVGKILRDAVAEHKKRGNAGVFKVLDLGDYGFCIVPEQVRDEHGVYGNVSSPLDISISFPEEIRSPQTTFALIAKKVGEEADTTIGALGDFSQGQGARIGAKADPTREVLIKFLGSIGWADPGAARGFQGLTPKRTWQLLYNIDQGHYILYSKIVTREVPKSTGPSEAVPVMIAPPLPDVLKRRVDELKAAKAAAGTANSIEPFAVNPTLDR